MKKTYIAPKMETTEMKMSNMIALSDPKVLSSGLAPTAAESRRLRFLDDEEEEFVEPSLDEFFRSWE